MVRTLVVALILTTPLAAQEIERGAIREPGPGEPLAARPHTLSSEDAPFYMIFEDWLSEASTWRDDEESFAAWCARYGIEASWPSADRLAVVLPALNDAYFQALEAERAGAADRPAIEWKVREIGRLWTELHAELAADGLPWSMYALASLIDRELRPGFALHSTEPFTAERVDSRADWFWSEVERHPAGREFATTYKKGARQ